MDNREIWESANRLVNRYGNDADVVAGSRAFEFLKRAYPKDAAVWRRIVRAIKELERTEAAGPIH